MTNRGCSTRRATASKPVRQVARAARMTLRELAMTVLADQPSHAPREHEALMRWLTQSAANADPGADDRGVAEHVVARIEEMAEADDETAKAVLESQIHEVATALARTAIALHGARWVPAAPEVPQQERQDAIASTVLELTGWTSVDDETVQAIYRWLYGDEALFVAGTEMRVEAGLRMLDSGDPRPVHVPHPDTGELVLVTREEVIEHAEADGRVLEAARRYEEKQAQRHERLIRALRPYGDRSTSVGDAVRRAASDLGIDATDRGFDELARLVVAAAEARAGSPEAGLFATDARSCRSAPGGVQGVTE